MAEQGDSDEGVPDQREFDIVLFGATGLTGRYSVEQLYKNCSTSKEGLRWAVAGRDKKKIAKALHEVSSWVSADLNEGPLAPPVIIADVFNQDSLTAMARRTRCIINTVGPYTQWGEPVIKACLDARTHMLDLSAEFHYNESMRNKYHRTALKQGVLFIATAGYDSVPCEMLLQYVRQKFPGRVNCLETFVTFSEGPLGFKVNSGTWTSILEILTYHSLQTTRFIRERAWGTVFDQPWQDMEFRTRRPLAISWRSPVPGYTIPFLGGEKSVVSHSEFFRREMNPEHKRTQVQTYLYMPRLLKTIGFAFMILLAAIVVQFPYGKRLLANYPGFFSGGFFSKDGPTREQVLTCGFTMLGIATGWYRDEPESAAPRRRLVARLDGPEVAYLTTSICLVNAAICLVTETEKLPLRGGYLTPGFALERTSLFDRLVKNGFEFSIVEQEERSQQ